jgi:hypothetical protein
LAAAATAAARAFQRWGAASITAAVAVPLATPPDRPDNTLPSNRSSRPAAIRKTTALATAKTMANNNIGRRPIASDQRPNASSAASTPPTNVAYTTVEVNIEKCIRSG